MNNFYKKTSKNYLKNNNSIYKDFKKEKIIGPTQNNLAQGHAVQPN